jgi:hypothetical protein
MARTLEYKEGIWCNGSAAVQIEIKTLWRTASQQCELVVLGLHGCRLRLWVKGALVIEEEVFGWSDAARRAAELRLEWPQLVP